MALFFNEEKLLLDLDVELERQPLSVTGLIPEWINSTFLRIGPINFTLNQIGNPHWFDGLAMAHAFSIANGQVHYSNRFVRTDAYQTVMSNHSLNYSGFATTYKKNRIIDWFFSKLPVHKQTPLNNSVFSLHPFKNWVAAYGYTPPPLLIDPENLETIGAMPTSAHQGVCTPCPFYDTKTKETIFALLEHGSAAKYRLYSTVRGEIATILTEKPSYIHSIFATEHFVIIPLFPLFINTSAHFENGMPLSSSLIWEGKQNTEFLILDRASGKEICRRFTVPCFALHGLNAFESNDEIVLDLVCYDDPKILKALANHYRPSYEAENRSPSHIVRFTLNVKLNETQTDLLFKKFPEFPAINMGFQGRPYCYSYLADSRDTTLVDEIRPLYKLNVLSKEFLEWSQHGCYPSGPIFIPSQNGLFEDDGIILSVILDAKRYNSFLLFINAKNFQEVARAQVPHIVPPGMHGVVI